jgi:hypothetical protein
MLFLKIFKVILRSKNPKNLHSKGAVLEYELPGKDFTPWVYA